MNSKVWIGLGVAVAALAGGGAYYYQTNKYANKVEAEAMVKNVVAAVKADQKGTFADITSKNPKWQDRDLYPVVYDMKGKVHAHGQNEKSVGKEVINLKDPDGKLFVKERVELAASKGKFWHDYRFTDPVTKKALKKEAYCEKLEEFIVCAGVYKR